MSEDFKSIWDIVDNLRIHDMVMLAREHGVNVSYSDITKYHHYRDDLCVPDIINLFVIECIINRQNVSIFEPWGKIGEFADVVAKAINAKKSICIIPNVDDFEVANILRSYPYTELICSNPVKELDREDWLFDIIFCCQLFNKQAEEIILKSSKFLSPDGIAFFVVPENYFIDRSYEYKMNKVGLYVDSAVYLPSGTFGTSTSIAAYIITVQYKKFDNFFVAELSNKENIKTIANNWKKRIEGKALSLGTLIDRNYFYSYPYLVKEKEISRLSKLANLNPIPIKEIAFEFNREKKVFENGFEEKPNSVYLPMIGMSDCISYQSELNLKLKPQNYIQIVLDPSEASADYVARFLNTELGKIIRESIFSGNYIPKITLSTLSNVILYLPPLDSQIKVIGIQSQISDLKSQIINIEKQLWSYPLKADKYRKTLNNLNREQGFEQWMESLPCPLASILWRYYADDNPQSKKDHLFNYFEAMIQFNVMIMLSALYSDKASSVLSVTDSYVFNAKNLNRSTFGTWLTIGEQLAKKTREELSDKEKREKCLRNYRRNRAELLDGITSKKLFESLRLVLDYRNKWKGHGGIEGKAESIKRLTLLEAELAKTREVIADCFEGSMIIKPEESVYNSGIYKYRVLSLMGTRTMFKKAEVKTTIPLDVNKLYLIDFGHLEPLELIPLVRLMPSPKTEENAFYFYNRIEKNGIRLVSYHFEKESEILIEDNFLESILTSLRKEK